jgi:porin
VTGPDEHGTAHDARPFTQWERLTGDWCGARTRLEEQGLTIDAEYIFEWSSVWDGGIRQRDSHRNALTLDLDFDLERVVGLEGGRFFLEFLHVNAERGGSLDAGDFQGYSNIENEWDLTNLFEVWYEQRLWDDRLRLKIGKVDANTEFDYLDAAVDFANSSAGYSPTIFVFPSYPDPATSVNVFVTPVETDRCALTIGYGFYDGAAGVDGVRTGQRGPSSFFHDDVSDDYFNIAEAALTWDTLGDAFGGRLALGGWWHTGEFARFDGGEENGTGGVYLTFEQRLTAPGGPEGDRGWYIFANYGHADAEVSEIETHVGIGLVGRGLWARRPVDAFGVYLTYADLSREAVDLEFEPEEEGELPPHLFVRDEFVVDVYYRVQLTPAVFVQPDLQYIANPSGDDAVDDALAAGIRVGLTF